MIVDKPDSNRCFPALIQSSNGWTADFIEYGAVLSTIHGLKYQNNPKYLSHIYHFTEPRFLTEILESNSIDQRYGSRLVHAYAQNFNREVFGSAGAQHRLNKGQSIVFIFNASLVARWANDKKHTLMFSASEYILMDEIPLQALEDAYWYCYKQHRWYRIYDIRRCMNRTREGHWPLVYKSLSVQEAHAAHNDA